MTTTIPKACILFLTGSIGICKPPEQQQGWTDVSQEDAPQAYAETYCNILEACACPTAVSPSCVEDIAQELAVAIEAAEAASLTYHPDCMADYLNDLQTIGCQTWEELEMLEPNEFWALLFNTCKVFDGTAVSGEPCTSVGLLGDSCTLDYECDSLNGCQTSIFSIPTYKYLGEPCDPEAQHATEFCIDSYCANSPNDPMTYTCVPQPNEGEDCTESHGCAGDAWCDGNDVCQPPVAEGEACTSDVECMSELICSSTSSTCAPQPTEGQPCSYGQCASGLECVDEPSACRVAVPLLCDE